MCKWFTIHLSPFEVGGRGRYVSWKIFDKCWRSVVCARITDTIDNPFGKWYPGGESRCEVHVLGRCKPSSCCLGWITVFLRGIKTFQRVGGGGWILSYLSRVVVSSWGGVGAVAMARWQAVQTSSSLRFFYKSSFTLAADVTSTARRHSLDSFLSNNTMTDAQSLSHAILIQLSNRFSHWADISGKVGSISRNGTERNGTELRAISRNGQVMIAERLYFFRILNGNGQNHSAC